MLSDLQKENEMTIDRTTATKRVPMSPLRKTSLVAGVLYLLTFVSIPTLFLYVPVHDRNYILGPGPDTAVVFGGILEVIVALAGIGTAVALYPVLKRQNQGAALGLVGSRVLEAAGILAGVACLLAIVSLRQAGAGAGALITGQLAILYDRINLLSQSLMPAANDLLLGFLLYPSRLVPRVLPVLAFIGAPLLLASWFGVLFGLWDQRSTVTASPQSRSRSLSSGWASIRSSKVLSPRPLQLTWSEVTPARLPARSPSRASLGI
jgi:hypothetical protein